MNTEDKMLLLETMITNIAADNFAKNGISPTMARYIMLSVYNRFFSGMVDGMLQTSLSRSMNANPDQPENDTETAE